MKSVKSKIFQIICFLFYSEHKWKFVSRINKEYITTTYDWDIRTLGDKIGENQKCARCGFARKVYTSQLIQKQAFVWE